MAIRIIKPGSQEASKVRRFSFLDNPEDLLVADPAPPDWMQHQAQPKPRIATPDPAPEPPHPVVDVALIEKKAYESGFLQGEKAGKEIAEKKVDAMMRRYSETILEIGKLKPRLYSEVEREVVKLAVEVAKKIVHREIQVDQAIIQTLVKVALGHVAEKTAVTIHLHPSDYNYVLERKADLAQGDQAGREIVLLADKSIERGGCLVKTECGDIDARIEEKFREIEQGFFES
jgi:flagellar assembly protein FliH